MNVKRDGWWCMRFDNEEWEDCKILRTKRQAICWGNMICEVEKNYDSFEIGQVKIIKSQFNLFQNPKNFIIENKEKIYLEDNT
jgi:hypothetical protein